MNNALASAKSQQSHKNLFSNCVLSQLKQIFTVQSRQNVNKRKKIMMPTLYSTMLKCYLQFNSLDPNYSLATLFLFFLKICCRITKKFFPTVATTRKENGSAVPGDNIYTWISWTFFLFEKRQTTKMPSNI